MSKNFSKPYLDNTIINELVQELWFTKLKATENNEIRTF